MKALLLLLCLVSFSISGLYAQNSATWEVWRDADLFKLSTHTTDSVTYSLEGGVLTLRFELREAFRGRPTRRLQITIPNFTGVKNYNPVSGSTTYWENFSTTEKCACFDHMVNDVNITKYDSVKKEISGTFNWKCVSNVSGTEINYRIRNGIFDVGAPKIALELNPKDSLVLKTVQADTTLRITITAKLGTTPVEGASIFVNNKLEENGPTFTLAGRTDAAGVLNYNFPFKKNTPEGNYEISFYAEKTDVRKSDTSKVTVFWGNRYWHYKCAGINVLEFDAGEGKEWKPESQGSAIITTGGPVMINGVIRVEGPLRINTTAGQVRIMPNPGTRIVMPDVQFAPDDRGDLELTNVFDPGLIPLPDCDGIISLALDPASQALTKKLTKKLPGGIELSLKSLKIINRADAKGIDMKGKITLGQARAGCDSPVDTSGGFDLSLGERIGVSVGVAITTAGWEKLSIDAENIALTHALCVNEFSVNADFVNRVYSLAGKLTFPVKGRDISLGGSVLFKNNPSNPDNKLHFDSLSASLDIGDCKPVPQTPLCFKALSFSTSGWSSATAAGRAVRVSATFNSLEQIILAKSAWVKQYFDAPEIFEFEATGEYRHPLIFSLTGVARALKLPKLSKSKPWQYESGTTIQADLNRSVGLYGEIKFGHLGLDDYFLSGTGGINFSWTPTLSLSCAGSYTVRIPAPGPDVLRLPVAGPILRFMSLSGFIPQTFGTGSVNALVSEDDGFRITASVDVRQHPIAYIRHFGRLSLDVQYKDTLSVTSKADTLGSIRVTRKDIEDAQGAAQPLHTIAVDGTVERVFVLISGANTAPVSRITSPSGTTYDGTSADSSVILFATPGNEMTSWTIVSPEEGDWTLALDSPAEGDEVDILVNRKATPFEVRATQNGRTVTVEWDPTAHSSQSDDVRIFVDIDNRGFDGSYVGKAFESTGSYSFEMPTDMTECSYRVYATRFVSGQPLISAYANEPISTPGTGVPQPAEVRATSNLLGRTVVSWRMEPGSAVNGFLVNVRNEDGTDSLYARAYAEDRSVELTIENHTTKRISITAFDRQGARGCATEALEITTGVDDADYTGFVRGGSGLEVRLAPNPTSGYTEIGLRVDVAQSSTAHIHVTDLLGCTVALFEATASAHGWSNVYWDATTAQPGSYLVRVTCGAHTCSVPVMVLR